MESTDQYLVLIVVLVTALILANVMSAMTALAALRRSDAGSGRQPEDTHRMSSLENLAAGVTASLEQLNDLDDVVARLTALLEQFKELDGVVARLTELVGQLKKLDYAMEGRELSSTERDVRAKVRETIDVVSDLLPEKDQERADTAALDDGSTVPDPTEQEIAERLRDALYRPENRPYLGALAADWPKTAGAAWRRAELGCLRLPPRSARLTREHTRRALGEWYVEPSDDDFEDLPQPASAGVEILVRPLPAFGVKGIRRTSGAPNDEGVVNALEGASGKLVDVSELGRLATLVLALTKADRELWLALENFPSTMIRFDGKLEQQYRKELLTRLRAYANVRRGDTATEFEFLLAVHEALTSVVHRPPAVATTWWSALSASVGDLTYQAKNNARDPGINVQVLGLKYASLQYETKNDIKQESGGETGDVLACLRPWAKIGTRVLPGRVIYRPERRSD